MSTFKNIQGKNIRSYANNAPNATAGEMWYNRSDQKLKGVVASAAWSSSSNMITGREYGGSGIGTLLANIVAGGYIYSPGSRSSLTEQYNGTGWTAITSTTTNKYLAGGAGSATAALVFGGSGVPPFDARTEEYNGTSWSEQDDMSTARSLYNAGAGGPGGQTAGLAAGGYSGSNTNSTEEYGGASWTSGGNLGTARRASWLCGTQTAAMLATGYVSAASTTVENYDGSSWTTGTSTNVARSSCSGSAISQDSALIFGGNDGSSPAGLTSSEEWNGTSWAATPTMAAGRSGINGAGSTSAAIAASGFSSPPDASPSVTEEYNFSTNTVTSGAWSSGANYPTNLMYGGSAGTKTATVVYGGSTAPPSGANRTTATNEYNGSSWTSGGAMPTATMQMANLGTQTAAGSFGGAQPSGNVSTGYEYDGSSWTSGGSIGSAGYNAAGFGILTAGVIAGGSGDRDYAAVYDGSTWTAKNNLNTGRFYTAGTGTTTVGIVMGGTSPPGAVTANTETFDGTSWTEVGNLNTAKRSQSGGGDSRDDALLWAGSTGSDSNSMEGYDGTSWSTRPSLAIAKRNRAGSGGSSTAIATGGINPVVNNVEEFTAETTSANIVDITTS